MEPIHSIQPVMSPLRPHLSRLVLALWLAACPTPAGWGAETLSIELPPPNTDGGLPLMAALKARKTTREFSAQPVDDQTLGNLLWAAFGVNRAATGGRTAPSAMNAQETDLYVACADGLFRYEAGPHHLRRVLTADLRALTGGQEFARQAPLALIYVADLSRLSRARPADREFYAAVDTGYISQNVYLYCASAGLATVVHDLDRPPLAQAMGLGPDQRVILAQAVGFPKPPEP